MKHLIQQILKEEFNPDDLTSPEINMSPETELEVARSKYGWRTYIPQIKKKISFSIVPESWNLSAGVFEEDIESKGHGSFGDDSHIRYEPYNLLSSSDIEYFTPYYQPKTEKLDHTAPDKGNYELYDVKDAIDNLKTYSEEAEKVTVEFKKNIERLFADYKQKINAIANNSDFSDGNRRVKVVDVDKEGNFKSERDFRETGDGWWDQPRHFKSEIEKKHREF